MSLLPALFRNTDPIPMALGAKIVAPVPKRPDPFKAFEKGNHTPDDFGRVTVVDSFKFDPRYKKDLVHIAKTRDAGEWFTGEFGPVKNETVEFFRPDTRSPAARTHAAGVREAQDAVRAAVARGVSQERLRNVLKVFGAPRVTALADRDLERFTREVSALTNTPILGITPQVLYTDEVADPRQNAIAAKMAEVQRQKQALRALVRKDGKR